MKTEFWLEKWQDNEIGFHREEYNPNLLKWWPAVEAGSNDVVLVPLCGKTLDLRWLAGAPHTVIGAELSPLAVEAFFREIDATPECIVRGEHRLHSLDRLTIVEGDFLKWRELELPRATRFYDRAAAIALPNELRASYLQVLHEALAPGAQGLMLTIGYPQEEMDGPPFSLRPADLHSMTKDLFKIELLSDSDALVPGSPMAERGLTELREYAFKLTRIS